mmetsp:Transcript_4761/g.16384  ORF Transcript_4761/g.16384 Transcript_4761/m.16384 type:complete len:204 (+) Transcript_4761:2053-2664(+)
MSSIGFVGSSPPNPSIWTRNSVFIRLDDSCSPSDFRAESKESISSTNITEGAQCLATANNARTIFSPSPIHLEVNEDAEIEKNVALHCEATAFPIIVFPVPGGPNKSKPLGTARAPVKSSGFVIGHTASSCTAFFACSRPTMLSQDTVPGLSRTSPMTRSTISRSSFKISSGMTSLPVGCNRFNASSEKAGPESPFGSSLFFC